MFLFPLHFYRTFLQELQWAIGSLCISVHEKCCTTSFCPPRIQIRNPLSFKLVPFTLVAFKMFFFVFSCQTFNYHVSSHGILWIFFVNFTQPLESISFSLSSNCGVFSHYFLEYLFSLLFFFWDSNRTKISFFFSVYFSL